MVRYSSFGYTLIELMIVLAVIGVVVTIVFLGIGSYRQADAVVTAEREFLSNLRAMQNKVDNGADGESVKSVDLVAAAGYYDLQTVGEGRQRVSLPSGVTLAYSSPPSGSPVSLCFSNRYLTTFDNTNKCGPAVGSPCVANSGSGYICDRSGVGVALAPASLTVTFTNGSVSKKLVVEGSGMRINRIYGQ